ncbi:MAG TPA: DUF4440 domain-containing protein [Allocoleopsis sp.]
MPKIYFYMRIAILFMFILVLVISACKNSTPDKSSEAVAAITKAEKDFAQMVADKGIPEGFAYYAAPDATIRRRNDTLIHGVDGIRNFYSAPLFKTATVTWAPDHVEASTSGDLGFTYGHYTWKSPDSSGKVQESTGIFHTVWKKQKDGSWKYIWD